MYASIAQWLEHWSCKPGVVSSILTGGYSNIFDFQFQVLSDKKDIQATLAFD